MRNYRPIPLLLLFPKYPKCYAQHLHTNNILINEEFGFRKGIPTETATFRTTDCVLKCVTKKMHVGGIFCDYVIHGIHNTCIQTTNWSMNSMVLGKGYQQKLLPSEQQTMSWNVLPKNMHVGGIFCDYVNHEIHNTCIQTTNWSMNSMVLGKGYQQKLLPSEQQTVSWNVLPKKNACGRNILWLCESWNFVSLFTILWNSTCSWRLFQVLCKKQKRESWSSIT